VLGDEVVAQVLAGPEKSPVSAQVRAVLPLLAKVTQTPDQVGADDIDAVRAAGVSDAQLDDALAVAYLFNIINRMADALGFRIPTAASFASSARFLLKRGYK